MKIRTKIIKENLSKVKTDLAVIECEYISNSKKLPAKLMKNDGGIDLDKNFHGIVKKIITEELFTGALAKTKLIHTNSKTGPKRILVIGIGKLDDFSLDTMRIVGAKIAKYANEIKAKDICGMLENKNIKGLSPEKRIQALIEGMNLGNYEFTKYKNKKHLEKKTFETVKIIFQGNPNKINQGIKLGTKISEAMNYAKDLINATGYDVTPAYLANEAKKIAKENNLKCKIFDERGLKKQRMNLLLAVAQGALNPARLIHLTYKPKTKPKATITIVGKGVTFDSGGYNLKPSRHIEDMKHDMSGAAAVLGLMKIVKEIKPNLEIHALIPAAENMIDGKAHKPGDIIESRSGKTVEIINTDAEGRLLLADAFDYALEQKPDIIIDLATLTGHVLYGLGEIYTAILGNDQKLIDKIITAAKAGGEPTWQLPLEKEYLKGLKAGIADLNNNGKSLAGTIVASLFLHEFIGKTKWAHLDIACSAWYNEEKHYRSKGATGAGIQTLVNFLMDYYHK